MTTESLYWITRLTEIKDFLTNVNILASIFFVIAFIVLIVSFLVKLNSYEDSGDYEFAKSVIKISMPVSIMAFVIASMCSIANVFIPTTKEYFAIKTLPIICSKSCIDKAQKLIPEALDATADYIKSLNDANKNKTNK